MEELVITRDYLRSLPEQVRQEKIRREVRNYAYMIRTSILAAAKEGYTSHTLRNIDILRLQEDREYPRLVREQLQQWFPDCKFQIVTPEEGYFIIFWE